MNKRITSLLLCFVMVFAMLATAVPALAAPITSTQLKVIPDKTTASPGETITYTIIMGPVSDMGSMQMVLDIPTGLTYVENSAKLTDGLRTTLGFDTADWTEVSKMVNGVASAADYESATDTELAKFQCKVDDGATGSLEVGLTNLEFGSCQTFEYHTDRFSVVKTPVTITAAPRPATGISLNKTATTIYTGNTETLIATVEPTDTTDTVVWTSSKESVATVDNTGKVTAVAPGTATITAKAGDKTATCTVTVENAPCTHTSKTPVPAKASTCEEKGWDAYFKCDGCGQLFDNAGNKIDAIPYLPLAAHSLTPVAAKAATCTENGNKAYYKCDVCGKWFEDATANVEITDHSSVVLTALGHDYTERIEDAAHKKATATDCRSHDTYWYDCTRGDHNAKDDPAASDKWYESTNAGPHSYDESAWGYKGADGHAHKCRYDDTHDTPVAHTPGAAATETTPQTCTECGYVITPALGHTHNMTPVAAKAATCTENGNKAYYVCSGCSKWFEDATGNVEITDHSSVVLTALGHDWKDATCTEPKTCKRDGCGATEGAANGHNAGTEWKTNETHHWHICLTCGEKLVETEGRHNPDREAPTVNDPVKCSVCDYEITPALETVKVEIPFTVTVKQGGNVAPGKQTFELEIFEILNRNANEYSDVTVTASVETNGKGDYTAKLVIKGSEEQVNAMICEGFYVREKNTGIANWEYSDAVWYVNPNINGGYDICPAVLKTSDNGDYYEPDMENAAEKMTFVNTYTENKTVTPEDTKPEDTKPEDTKSPQTGDNSNMILWIALLFVSGGVLAGTTLYSRKRKSVK